MAKLDVPVLFLIFNRPDTTSIVFDAIKEARPKKLYVAADGPRFNNPNEIYLCNETRAIINGVDWDCELKTLYRVSNLGCESAVSSAISWFFEHEEMGIILEDDCLPNLTFFGYCKELLIKYRDEDRIMLIGGHSFLSNNWQFNYSYYFSQYPMIWGWATWRRAWQNYDGEMAELDAFLELTLPKCYSSSSQRRHISECMQSVKSGKINSWAYPWLYSILNANGIVVTPSKNMIVNLGFRNQGTHLFLKDSKREISAIEPMPFPLYFPNSLEIGYKEDYAVFKNVFTKNIWRLMRLLKENGVKIFISYFWNRLKGN